MGVCLCDDQKKVVDCSGQELNYIPPSFPIDTITLRLSDNNIKSIEVDDFKGAERIKHLDLGNNMISNLDALSFRQLRLATLDLSENQLFTWNISVIEPMAHSLQILNWSQNFLEEIVREMFDVPLPQLRELILTETTLRHIEDRSFSRMNRLKVLRLNRNLIKTLNNETFFGLVQLQELYLDNNFFNFFPSQPSFAPIQKSLLVFSFSGHNRISQLPMDISFPLLQTLNISHCNLNSIANFTFVGVPKLRILDLSNNFIRFLAAESFNGMKWLQILMLAQNGFVAFPYRALSRVSSSLKELNFDNNAIYRITATPSIEHLLSKIEILSLRHTYLTQIDGSSFFRELQALNVLRISYSRLEELPKEALSHLTNLYEFEFNGNLISR